ncbi:MAG TPA: T9SS type A sorting domain-containing protein [Bacteroidales bacterium]|nr:T9SS type A sorting domain-containing protein [Bacteroidales bacterium]
MATIIAGSILGAEKRYVFALGGIPKTDPLWQSTWVDMRLNDIDRILYIWPSGNSVAGTPAVGTGSLGQTGYLAFTVSNLGWWGVGYYVGPDSGNPAAEISMTDVTDSWYLHFAVRTDCATDITINLYGCSPDPTDPFISDRTVGRYKLTTANLPLSKRDKTQWVEFNVPLTELLPYKDNVLTPTLKLSFVAPVKKQNYLTFSGGNDTGSFIAWDNVYLGSGATGISSPAADALDVQVVGNLLKVKNNTAKVEIFSISGVKMITSLVNDIDISNLASGIYLVKAGNQISKFSK